MTKKDTQTNVTKPELFSMKLAEQHTKEVNEKYTYTLKNGTDLEFYGVFPETIIQELLEEAQTILFQIGELDINITDPQFDEHILFLIIKHFTHLKDQLSDEYLEQVAQYRYLIDSEFVHEVYSDVFLKEEVQKVFDRFAAMKAQLELFLHTQEKTKKLADDLKKRQEEALKDLQTQQKKKANKPNKK